MTIPPQAREGFCRLQGPLFHHAFSSDNYRSALAEPRRQNVEIMAAQRELVYAMQDLAALVHAQKFLIVWFGNVTARRRVSFVAVTRE